MSGTHIRTRLQSLAATWRVWCTLMLAFGRQVDVLQKMRADRALVQVELLEAALYAGLVQLSANIAAHNSEALEEEDANALSFLKTAHVLFSVLTLAIHQLKTELAAEAERHRALCGYGATGIAITETIAAPRLVGPRPGFFDSG